MMENDNRTDKDILVQGLKTLAFSLLSIIIGPILLSIAFREPNASFHIPILIIGCLISLLAIFLIFRGIKLIMDSMFGKK